MRRLKIYWAVLTILTLVFAFKAYAWNRARADDYGRVVISKHSRRAGIAPVIFDHWVHRSRFTCRLCHVDIGFAMEENGTNITAETNKSGFYCGSCHNGNRSFQGKVIFSACSENDSGQEPERCDRCHSQGKKVARENDFSALVQKLPKEPFGNEIDWEEAEAKGLIKPVDFLEGVSIEREPLKSQKDFSMKVNASWIGEVIFSHEKHAVWNGCEVCHPEIFPSVKKGVVKYSMFQIAEGQYCGVCHDKVAFSLVACQRCHTKQVRMAY